LGGKRLQLLKEAVPKATRVAILLNPTGTSAALQLREAELAARRLGVKLHPVEAQRAEDLETTFQTATVARGHAFLWTGAAAKQRDSPS